MPEQITIVGSGIIGRSWAMLFCSVGHQVTIFDIKKEQVDDALKEVRNQLNDLQSRGLLRGNLSAAEQMSCIKGCHQLQEAVKDAAYIQECIPENMDMKKSLWQELDSLVNDSTILASSTSTFLPSTLSENLRNRSNFLVCHPVNPPYHVPLVEIIPSSWTNPQTVQATKNLMDEIGQCPVVLNKEVPGFAVNRIQYAILNECWNLINDDVISVSDLDKVMSDGLGMRYAFLGPLETAHLNADGFKEYCSRYANNIYDVSEDFKPHAKFSGPNMDKINEELLAHTPLESLQFRRQWRDAALIKLSQFKTSVAHSKYIN